MSTDLTKCPDCGAPTRERKSTKPGIKQWFPCTRYPHCKGAHRVFEGRKPASAPVPTFDVRKELTAVQGSWDAARPMVESAPVVEKAFTPSPYQAAIFDWITSGKGHAVVEAVAGSGKTTTMVEALRRMSGRVLFTAFNQSIAQELARRAPSHVTVSTLHSLGLRIVRRAFPGIRVDQDKLTTILERPDFFPVVKSPTGDLNRASRNLARKAAGLAKATLVDARDTAALLGMMDRYGIDADDDSVDMMKVAGSVARALDECQRATDSVDFDDMIWLPVVLGLPGEKFDWVCVDETQDMNASQLKLVLSCVRRGTGRVIAVGDRHQSIYGFRGADTEAIPRIIKELGATVLPLSITYRCPASHVALAQALVPAIQARPDAPAGVVRNELYDKAVTAMASGDMVLCRTNAPLVGLVFELIRNGRKACIRGRDIADGLASLVRKVGGRNAAGMAAHEFAARLVEYRTRETAKLSAAKRDAAIGVLEDKCETILAFLDGAESVADVLARIGRVFDDQAGDGVVCSSVHRAKGLEADRVWILKPELMPHPSAKRDWEIQSELHVKYVALTRSKNELIFVEE